MKLILCPTCSDVVGIRQNIMRKCFCGDSYGKYTDDLQAIYGGKAIPIGFANSSLNYAIKNQPEEGMGEEFEAFVIPKKCPTFWKEENKKNEK